MLRILTPLTLKLISRSDKVSPYLTRKIFLFFHFNKIKKKKKNMAELFGGRSYTSQSFTGSEVFNMPGAISANSSQKKSWQGHQLVSSPPSLTFPPCAPLFLLVKLDLFIYLFFISYYKFSYFGAESASCFACEKSIAITSKTGRKTRVKRKRQAPIPASLTLPDGCHLP